jgi:transposase
MRGEDNTTAIDVSFLSNGKLYTFVTNRDCRCGKGCLIALVEGTKSEDVIEMLRHIDEVKRNSVKEFTLDLSDSMCKIVSQGFSEQISEA